jgi:sulfatase maturation enzyme AslB (radical SAM superfamily)
MRIGYLETHGQETYHNTLQYLDINIDYTCNLACVTCGPDLSTTWRNELKIPGRQVRPHLEDFFEKHIKKLDLTHLREVRMWGGEPLLTNTHIKILEFIIEQGNAANIKLMYNTNGTQRITEKTKKLIEQFEFARISFSIDEIGKQFEYLRYPAKWAEVEENLFWWRDNLPHNSMLSFTVTASVLNVLTLNNVYDWWSKNFTKSIYGDDIEIYTHQAFGIYGLENMPQEMLVKLQSINDYCQPWIQSFRPVSSLNSIKLINDTLRANDIRRGQDFA